MLVTGAAGSGKTSLKYRLFGKELPTVRCSTALAEAAIRAISREIVGTDLTGWFKVTPDELMAINIAFLKSLLQNLLRSCGGRSSSIDYDFSCRLTLAGFLN